MIWTLDAPPVGAGAAFEALQPLDGVAWTRPRFVGVPIDLGELALQPVNVDNGIVPRFNDPFSTYEIKLQDSAVRVTVYESNYDGALLRGGKLHSELREWIAARYGVHRWSDHQWK